MRVREHRPDGTVHNDPCLQDCQCQANYRGRPTIPLRTPRQKGQESCTDHGKIGGKHDTEVRL